MSDVRWEPIHPIRTVHLSEALINEWDRYMAIEHACADAGEWIVRAIESVQSVAMPGRDEMEERLAGAAGIVHRTSVAASRARARMISRLSAPDNGEAQGDG